MNDGSLYVNAASDYIIIFPSIDRVFVHNINLILQLQFNENESSILKTVSCFSLPHSRFLSNSEFCCLQTVKLRCVLVRAQSET
jgi:hypothetical protein